MTDTTAPQGAETAAAEDTPFDAEFQAFLDHDFGAGQEEPQEEAAPAEQTEEQKAAAAAEAAKTSTEQKLEGNAEPAAPAAADVQQQKEEKPVSELLPTTVDPSDLAAMMGLKDVTPAKPSGEADASETPDPSGKTSPKDEPYTPFTPDFKLRPEIVSALFESESTEERHKALVGVMAGMANTITTLMDQRIKDHYGPQIIAATTSAMAQSTQVNVTEQDFFSEFPELSEYKKAVGQAFKIVASKDPNAPYSPELRNKVGELARAAVTQAGVKLAPRKGTAAPAAESAKPAPARRAAKAPPFEAGGARPSGGSSDNGPADLVSQLTEFM